MKLTVALLFCCSALALAQDAPVAARDRAKRELALRAAAQKILDTLQTPPAVSEQEARKLVAELGARMQQDVKRHADPAASRALCLTLLDAQRRQALDQWIDEAVARAREHTALPLEKADVLRHVGADWSQRVAADATAFAARHIDTAFGKARKQSVALQRDELKDLVRMPAEAELNPRLEALAESSGHHPPHAADLDQLADWLSSFATPSGRPLFNEVQQSTREASEQIVQRVKQQYGRQLAALKQAAASLPPAVIDADSIRAILLEATATAVKAMRLDEMHNRPDARATVYDPLTVIRGEAGRMAEGLAEDRLDAAIRRQKDLPIDAAAVETTVRADLKAHLSADASRRLLVTRYAAEIKPWLVARLAAHAGRTDDKTFSQTIDALITQSQRLKQTLSEHVGGVLDPVLPDIRRHITDDQLRTVLGDVPEAIAVLTPEAVAAIWTANRCEIVKRFDQAWPSLLAAGLVLDAGSKDRLLEESRQQLTATCNRLIPLACRTLREQANQLTALESDWTDRLRKDVESKRPLAKITTDWTRELDRRWRAYAEEQNLPYPDLFARTLDLLDKTVRKLYEAQEVALEQETAPAAPEQPTPEEEQPPEEEPVEEQPIDEPPPPPEEPPEESAAVTVEELLETLDFVLYFRDTPDGRSEAVLLDGSGASTRLVFDPGHVQKAVEAVYQSVIPAIEASTRGKATAHPKRTGILALFQRSRALDLKVAVLVGSEQVRHMMSILLRNRVELFVADWNANPANPTLELEWEDNLEIAP